MPQKWRWSLKQRKFTVINGYSSHKAARMTQGCYGHSKAFACSSNFFKMLCNCLVHFVLQVLSVLVTCVISIYWDICPHGNVSWHWAVRSDPGGAQALSWWWEEGGKKCWWGLCPPNVTPSGVQRCSWPWERAAQTQQGPRHQEEPLSSLTVFHTPHRGTVILRESPVVWVLQFWSRLEAQVKVR